ncbi:MAG: response regulator [Acidobacteriota bacterium]
MIETLIVDDESLARKRLARMLAAFDDVKIVGEAENGAEAVTRIEELRPALVLLDVQMPDLDGFAVLRMLDSNRLPLIVFVTAFDRYAIEAFEVNAIDYLLKPVRAKRLEQAIERAREKLASKGQASVDLKNLLQAIEPRRHLERLPVRSQRRILILGCDEITSLRIDHGLVFATTAQGEFRTSHTTFGQIEDRLNPDRFLRVHRQTIVNLDHVREVTEMDNSTARLTLSCGRQVSVSRAQMKKLREALNL